SPQRLGGIRLRHNVAPKLTCWFWGILFRLLRKQKLLPAIANTHPDLFSLCCAQTSRNYRKRTSESRLLILLRSSRWWVRFFTTNSEKSREIKPNLEPQRGRATTKAKDHHGGTETRRRHGESFGLEKQNQTQDLQHGGTHHGEPAAE